MSVKLQVAVPSHSGTIVLDCANTLVAAQDIVLKRGGSFSFRYQSGATVSLVRNAIAAEFLRSDSDLLLMLDADQAIERAGIERMLDFDKPVVGCIYPRRRFNWSKVKLPAGADPELIAAQAMEFVGRMEADESGNVPLVDGFARAEHVGTGTLLVRREAFEALMLRFPDLEGVGFGPDAYPGLSPNWGFFNPLATDRGLPLSEDISFCRRWRATGGEIWADVVSTAAHVGQHSFLGSYYSSWQAAQEGDGE